MFWFNFVRFLDGSAEYLTQTYISKDLNAKVNCKQTSYTETIADLVDFKVH